MKGLMKKLTVLLLALALTLTGVIASGCGPKDSGTKTILNVANYSGGVGRKWLDDVEKRFELAYENVSYEPGKKGVDLKIWHNRNYIGTTLASSLGNDDVYFTQEFPQSQVAKLNQLLDLTEFITTRKGSDNKTIFSKFTTEQVSGLKVNNKYYVIPHYEVFQGVVYDAGVFTNNNYYFAEEIDTDNTYPGTKRFVVDSTETKSCGPNGVLGDYDDGLPSSIAEFYKLLDEMKGTVDPFVYAGGHDYYTDMLTNAIFANISGADTMRLHLNFGQGVESTKNVARVVTSFDAGARPVVEPTTITLDNGYLMRQLEGLYYGVEVAQTVWSDAAYYSANIDESTSHTDAQNEFMLSGIDGQTNYAAMLIEGNYWYNEANDEEIFKDMMNDFPQTYTYKQPRFMTMPTQVDGTVTVGNGKAPVLVDNYNSYSFVNANIDSEKIDLALDFLSFCYTDEELVKFTVNTNGICRSLNYDVQAAFSQLTDGHALSLVNMRNQAAAANNIVRFVSDNGTYNANEKKFKMNTNEYWTTKIDNTTYGRPFSAAKNNRSAKEIFEGMAIAYETWLTMKV